MDLKKETKEVQYKINTGYRKLCCYYFFFLLLKYNKITGNSYLKLNAKVNVSLYLFTLKHKHIHIN